MQDGLVTKKLSVCPSVCLSNAWIVTKQYKVLPGFLNHTKNHLAQFSEKKNSWWGHPFYLKFWFNVTPLEQNRRFSVDIRL